MNGYFFIIPASFYYSRRFDGFLNCNVFVEMKGENFCDSLDVVLFFFLLFFSFE